MYTDGELAVHDNVVFKANTAAVHGGVVSLPLEIGFTLPAFLLFFYRLLFYRVCLLSCCRFCFILQVLLFSIGFLRFFCRFCEVRIGFIRCGSCRGSVKKVYCRASLTCVTLSQRSNSWPQVYMFTGGLLEVQDDVIFGANNAGTNGGVVSLPLEIGFTLPICCSFIGFVR